MSNYIKIAFITALFLGFVLAPYAYAGDKNILSDSKEIEQIENFVNSLSSEILDIIQDDVVSDDKKEDLLIAKFKEFVDTDWMGRFVLGRYRKNADAADIKRYLELYHDYLILSYIPKFREYSGETYEIIRIRKNEDGYIVNVEMQRKSADHNIRVDYRLLRNNIGELKVVDIIGEGVSLITTQRSDFGGLISRKGFNFFIGKLESKVTKLLKKSGADIVSKAQ